MIQFGVVQNEGMKIIEVVIQFDERDDGYWIRELDGDREWLGSYDSESDARLTAFNLGFKIWD